MGDLTCPFCNPPPDEILLANDLCYARYDKFPANPGHLLLIPFRHVAGLFDATDAELTPSSPSPGKQRTSSTNKSTPTATTSA